MPIEKRKPSSSTKPDPKAKSAKSGELRDDELRTIAGGMTGGAGAGAASCVSQT